MLHSTGFCPPSAFFLAFQLKKRDFAWGRICHLFQETKKWKGVLALYLSPFFCLHSLCIFALCAIVDSLHPTQASMPSLCPRGERTGRARLAKCTGGWVIGTAEWRMNSLDSRLNLLYIRIEQALSNNDGRAQNMQIHHYTLACTPLRQVLILYARLLSIVMYYCMITRHTHTHTCTSISF